MFAYKMKNEEINVKIHQIRQSFYFFYKPIKDKLCILEVIKITISFSIFHILVKKNSIEIGTLPFCIWNVYTNNFKNNPHWVLYFQQLTSMFVICLKKFQKNLLHHFNCYHLCIRYISRFIFKFKEKKRVSKRTRI